MGLHGILIQTSTDAGELSRRLKQWSIPDVTRSLQHEPAPDVDGPEFISISLEDLEEMSLARARYKIENVIVKTLVMSLNPERSNYLIARMLRVKEWRIRQIRIRAGIPSARLLSGRALRS